jgi:protein-L-isoaspartate(D-aspartate) O-methyltransferase
MVREQIAPRDISDERVLDAMLKTPRHLFVPPEERHLAYIDAPLAIGDGQTISQPYIVALMTQLLELSGDETVLEIGTGSGYQAAILAHIVKKVYSVERIPALANKANKILSELGIENVFVEEGDGSRGLPDYAPYEAIIVTAAAPEAPEPLKEQLAADGRLVVPVGSRYGQVLERWRRIEEKLVHEQIVPVAFVPLVGEHGWNSEDKSSSWWKLF